MFREVRGELVHVVEHGAGDPTIVGISGAFGNVEIWEQPFELLHRRFRTVAYDHFGTGLTHVATQRVTFDEQVALVGDLMDVLEIERCVLVGDSSCTLVATAAARLVESFAGVDVRPLLGSITAPTVVVHGALDRIHPLSGGEAFAAGIPDAELVVIPDAGHVPTLSRPERIADVVSGLVERLGG